MENMAAERLGYLDGGATAFWVIVGDGKILSEWKGSDGSSTESDQNDFELALDAIDQDPQILELKNGQVSLCEVGECGGSAIWKIPGGYALWSFGWSENANRSALETIKQLGLRVIGLNTLGEAFELSKFQVTSGTIALLVPFAEMSFTEADFKKVTTEHTTVVSSMGDAYLLPAENGEYTLFFERLGEGRGIEDEFGRYQSRLRIVKT